MGNYKSIFVVFAITFAIVNVFPLPVTPTKVWHRLPSSFFFNIPLTNFSIASGWSPLGENAFSDRIKRPFELEASNGRINHQNENILL